MKKRAQKKLPVFRYTRGRWGFEDKDNKHMITAGRDRKGAFIYICDPSYSPAKDEKGNSTLIAAAPTLYREVIETMERLWELLKKKKYEKDDELSTALCTIHMDLNRAAAIADGSWPSVDRVS